MLIMPNSDDGAVPSSAAELTIGLLGPLAVTLAGQPLTLTAGRQRTLFAVLALSANKDVSVDRLVTAIWREDPPDTRRRAVQTYVTRLRATLGAEAIRTSAAGYRLCVEPDNVDALRFGRLLNAASAATDLASRRALLIEALGLWRGAPFGGVQSTWLDETQSPRLVERYLTAVERHVDIDLAEGRYGELVARLGELTAQYPLRESLWVRLLVVLDRLGRQAEALERYEAIRVRIADELGVDPGPELQQAHADLLVNRAPRLVDESDVDPGSQERQAHADLLVSRAPRLVDEPGPPEAARRVVPQQLPADIDGFTGRDVALKALSDLAGFVDGEPSRQRMVISAIVGTAGIGKTALAVHWAHQIAGAFPDGQLYVDLRGFHPSGSAMTSADAVRGFLDALQPPNHQIPASIQAQVGLYRSLLAGKRVLVLLDNARDADQVRPLLPGSSGCLVIVTSRNPLPGLVATEGASAVNLDLFTLDESRDLLAHRLSHDRVAAEPEAADEIIDRCARLPLALAITAARAATRPTFPLRVVAAELRDTRGGLPVLDGGDAASDVRAVFSWSYRMLRPDAARLFRLLGLHVGLGIATPAAASLAGIMTDDVRVLLAELTRAHLITEHTPGRYAFHDLLRAYAGELARTHESNAEQQAALHRLFDHYVHTGRAAALLVDPHRDAIAVAAPQAGVTSEVLDDRDHAMAWFATEHRVLVAAVEAASRSGFDTHAWQVAWALADFLQWRGHWHDRVTTQQFALQAAQRLNHRAEQARAYRGLGHAYTRLGRHDDARHHIERALLVYREVDDPGGEARAHLGLSHVLEGQGDSVGALRHAQRGLDLYPPEGHEIQRARTLNVVGWCHAQLGDYRTAIEHCEQALVLQQELDDPAAEAATWDSLGYAYHHLGDHRRATDCYQHAVGLRRDIGFRRGEAGSLTCLGDTYRAAGDVDAARHVWQQALTILDQFGEHDADQVRARLQQSRPAAER